MACCHRLGDEMTAHFASGRRGDWLREEEPDVRTIARARPLDQRGETEPSRGVGERTDIFLPTRLVKVGGKAPAGRVAGEPATVPAKGPFLAEFS